MSQMTLLERVRFNVEWADRNKDREWRTVKQRINDMTLLELLTAVSNALEEMREEQSQ